MDPANSSNKGSKVWLITGCSSGFGRSFIPAILARGDKVIATARRLSDLKYIQGVENAKVLELDVTSSEETIRVKVVEATLLFGKIDVLVNNAGYVLSGVWEETSEEETLRQFQTNVFGPLKLTRAILPQMRSRRSGTIVFMSSISGWQGVGAGGPYSSSKFALEGAVECLEKETRQLGIRVHLFVIGQFRTNILDARRKSGKLDESIIEDYDVVKNYLKSRHESTDGIQPGNPELAVERILDVVRMENLSEQQAENLPLRIPLGSDAIDVMKRKCYDTLKSLDCWGQFASSTDFSDTHNVPSY